MPSMALLSEAKQFPVMHDRPFVFGVLGTWQKRKGMHDLVRAYFGSFKREHPVTLAIKTSAFGSELTIRKFKEKLTEEIAEIATEFGDFGFPSSAKMPRISLELGTDMSDQQVIDWISNLDCYVNPSYGEGLGIPHVWAKATGVPMVSSAYGAVGEMLVEIANTHSHSADVTFPHKLVEVGPEMPRIAIMFDKHTKWGGYDVKDLGAAMLKQFDVGRRLDSYGALATRSMFGVEKCLPAVREGLAKLVPADKASEWSLG
jgi:glycosyltransferase involved in cell wall biosynthesis